MTRPAKMLFLLLLPLLAPPRANGTVSKPDLTVASEGSGDHQTVQEAVNGRATSCLQNHSGAAVLTTRGISRGSRRKISTSRAEWPKSWPET